MRVWHMAHFMAMFFMCFFRGDLFHRAYFMAMFFMCLDVRCTHERSGSTGVHCMYIGSTLGRKVSNDLQMAMLRRLHECSGSSGTLCIYIGPMLGRKYSILGLERLQVGIKMGKGLVAPFHDATMPRFQC